MAFGNWVQGKTKDGGTTTSTTIVLTSNIATGDSIVVSVRQGTGGGTLTVTDSLSNTYVQDQTTGTVTSLGIGTVFHASADTGTFTAGACTITVAQTGSVSLRIIADEYNGVYRKNASAAANGQATGNGTTTVNVTTTLSCAIYGALYGANAGSGVWTAGASYTLREQLNPSGFCIASEDQGAAVASGTITVNSSFTNSAGTQAWATIGVGYQDASGAAPAFPPSIISHYNSLH